MAFTYANFYDCVAKVNKFQHDVTTYSFYPGDRRLLLLIILMLILVVNDHKVKVDGCHICYSQFRLNIVY